MNNQWLYKCCVAWLGKKHKTDFHARDDRLKLITAATEKGFTVEQVSQTIHQVNEDRRNERERLERNREDDSNNQVTVVAEEATTAAPAQQQPIRPSASKGKKKYSESGTLISGDWGGKSILDMADKR